MSEKETNEILFNHKNNVAPLGLIVMDNAKGTRQEN